MSDSLSDRAPTYETHMEIILNKSEEIWPDQARLGLASPGQSAKYDKYENDMEIIWKYYNMYDLYYVYMFGCMCLFHMFLYFNEFGDIGEFLKKMHEHQQSP